MSAPPHPTLTPGAGGPTPGSPGAVAVSTGAGAPRTVVVTGAGAGLGAAIATTAACVGRTPPGAAPRRRRQGRAT